MAESKDKPKVLFVDDEQHILDALKRSLHRDPLECTFTTSAQDALKMLASNDFDVVVSDEKMPEMSGTDFLSKVYKAHPETIRIMLTGHADLDAALQAINKAKIFTFLTKPCQDRTIVQAINEGLKEKQLQDKRDLTSHKSTKIGRWEWDKVSGELSWSAKFEKIMQHTPATSQGHFRELFSTVHPEDRVALVTAINNCLESDTSIEIIHRIQLQDGTIKWISQLLDHYSDETNNSEKIIGIIWDVTSHKEQELLLINSLNNVRCVLDETLAQLKKGTGAVVTCSGDKQ